MIETVEKKVKKPKKKNKHVYSLYKESKIGVHTTINGKGLVSRLFS